MLLKTYTILNGVKKTVEGYVFTASHNTKTRQISVKLRWKMEQREEREGSFLINDD